MRKLQKKKIVSIQASVIVAKGEGDFAMHDIVRIGTLKLLGEVIKMEQDTATIQVYESTTGLKMGEEVIGEEEPLSLVLGPGIMGNIFDGIQRPLQTLKKISGHFIERGMDCVGVDLEKKWHFVPTAKKGDSVSLNSILGEVKETEVITNKIMCPFEGEGEIIEIKEEGDYQAKEVMAKIKTPEEEILEITMIQKWPVRKPRTYKERLLAKELLLTGQRVVDTFFPLAKGGTAMLPGGFGTGKTMLQHQLAKWSDSDIIVYIGCGERGNEITEVLEEFPNILDPKTKKSLMERTVLIANTSNMPVAAREASIYTGITIAEYYRDMGYQVAIMADSTSRWAEALREISGSLEEMPAEEGFPSYLPSRLSEFYGRAGVVKSWNGKIGSVSIIGAVSPQGSDFSEPVTQNTKRFVHTFWGLSRSLAYARHYPAVDWNISYSEYIGELTNWYEENVDIEFLDLRQEIVKILEEENKLLEIARVIGQDVLSDGKKLILQVSKAFRVGFLRQSAMHEIDTFVPIQKQYEMLKTILLIYERSLRLIEKGIPISQILQTGIFEEYEELKFNIKNEELEKFEAYNVSVKNRLKKLEEGYQQHLQ